MSDDEGNNLLSPGANTHDNMQFLVFCTAVIRAVNRWQGLLRASIASAGNDHRLGANEAPPAILSIFLGDMLTDIFEQIEKGGAKSTKSGGVLDTGVLVLPKLPRDAGDRNRTSPFAFTGNKFEFRAVSSNQSIALSEHRAERRRHRVARLHRDRAREGRSRPARRSRRRSAELLPKVIKENKRIIFNGNGYSKEWEKEAGKRGLLNLKNTVDALPQLVTKEVVGAVREVQGPQRARAARALRDHGRDLQQDGERRGPADGADGQPLHPAGGVRVPDAGRAERGGGEGGGRQVGRGQEDARRAHASSPTSSSAADRQARRRRSSTKATASAEKHAKHFRDAVVPAMAALRETGDELELDDPARVVAARHVSRDAVHQVDDVEAGDKAGQGAASFRRATFDPALSRYTSPRVGQAQHTRRSFPVRRHRSGKRAMPGCTRRREPLRRCRRRRQRRRHARRTSRCTRRRSRAI